MASVSVFDLSSIYELLTGVAHRDNFWSLFETAFGTHYDAIAAEKLRSQWQASDFRDLPQIEVVSSQVLGSANGAYASSTNRVYLSDQFVASANSQSLIAVLLEEFGHFVDAQVNEVDTPGDEGEIFAALVLGKGLGDVDLRRIEEKDDRGLAFLDGEWVTVEQSAPIVLVVNTTEDENDGSASIGVGLSLRDAVSIANKSPNTAYAIKLKSGATYALSYVNNPTTGDRSLRTQGSITIETDGKALASVVNNTNPGPESWKKDSNYILINESAYGVVLNNLLISNKAGRGIGNNGLLKLNKTTVTGNAALTGGGVFNAAKGSLSLIDSNINDNFAELFGGGVYNLGTLTISNTLLSGNMSPGFGAGLYNHQWGSLTINSSTITGNSASGGGGVTSYGSLILNDNKIVGNVANTLSGGGILNFGTSTLDKNIITDNLAINGGGGGFYNHGGTYGGVSTLTNNILTNNKASIGGAIHNYFGTLTSSNNAIVRNKAVGGDGGGIFSNGTLTVFKDTIAGNEADSGGGVSNVRGTITLDASIVANNTAKVFGGGIYNGDGTATLLNNVIHGNTSNDGGGIANSGRLALTYTSIFSNNAERYGGGIANILGEIILNNNTVAGNTANSFGGGLYNNSGKWSSNSSISGNTANQKWGIDPVSGKWQPFYPLLGILDPKYPNVWDNGTYTFIPPSLTPPPTVPSLNPPPRLTPVFLLPGIGAVFPDSIFSNNEYSLNRGFDPNRMVPDPFYRTYDDLITTLENVGYVQGENLFVVTYDWRLPPGPLDGKFDGYLAGVTGDSITSGSYRYAVDYLGKAMEKAALFWYYKYGEELGTVDIIAHSTGALVARSYIQSDAYRSKLLYGLSLPKVANLITFGAPQRGATKALNPINNNWGTDIFYRTFYRTLAYKSYKDVLSGMTINGPEESTWGTGSITRKMIAGSKGDFAGDYDGDGNENQSGDDLNRDGLVNELDAKIFFLYRYNPTIKALLSTTLSDKELPKGSTWLDIIQPDARNQFLIDLNNGLDLYNPGEVILGSPTAWASRIERLTALYGTNERTATGIIRQVGPETLGYFDGTVGAVISPDGAILKDTIYGMGDGFIGGRPADPNEVWYKETFSTSGDGTVPLESLEGLFTKFPANNVYLKPFAYGINTQGSIEHSGLLSNPDALRTVLETLKVPFSENDISTKLYERTESIRQFSGFLSDLQGSFGLRRWLFSSDSIHQFIQSFVFGAESRYVIDPSFSSAYSFAYANLWLFNQTKSTAPSGQSPIIQLTGIGDNYDILLSGILQNHEFDIEYTGFLPRGETKEILLALPNVSGETVYVSKGNRISISVLANDVPLTGKSLELYEYQTRSENGGDVDFSDNGTPEHADDCLVYQAPSDFSGTDFFYYRTLSDGVRSLAKVIINVVDEPLPTLPAVSLEVAPASGVSEDGMSNLVFTFSRTEPRNSALTVNYIVGGTASLGTDYTGIAATPDTKTVTFAAGAATATVSLDTTVDSDIEADETVALTLAANTGYSIDTIAAVVGTILNDDVPPPVSVSLSNVTVSEASPFVVVAVNLSAATTAPISFTPTLAAGGSGSGFATIGSDTGAAIQWFDAATSTWISAATGVTIAAGSTTMLLRTSINNDTAYEGIETFQFRTEAISGPVTDASGASGTVSIADDGSSTNAFDANTNSSTPFSHSADNDTPTIAVSSITVSEASPFAVVQVSLSNASTTPIGFTPLLLNGSATTGTDTGSSIEFFDTTDSQWKGAAAGVSMAAGSSSLLLRTAINNDGDYEISESFAISTGSITSGLVTNPAGASGSATIKDDGSSGNTFTAANTTASPSAGVADNDAPLPTGTLSVAVVQNGNETGPLATVFRLSRTGSTASPLSVSYSLGGSALPGFDYNLPAGFNSTTGRGTVSFLAGAATVDLSVASLDDGAVDGNRSLSLNLLATGGYSLTTALATASIADNDVPPPITPSLSISGATVVETDSGTNPILNLSVGLSAPAASAITVHLRTAAASTNSATAGSDYTAIADTTLTFQPGSTGQLVSIELIGDNSIENTESFRVELFNATGATLPSGPATVQIVDNDSSKFLTIDQSASTTPQTFSGGSFDDVLIGGSAADVISGDPLGPMGGVDRITGNGGGDTLTGGPNADLFLYPSFTDSTLSNLDRIRDFTPSGSNPDRIAVNASALPTALWNTGKITPVVTAPATSPSLSDAAVLAFADKDIYTAGAQPLGALEAVLFAYETTPGNRRSQKWFVAVNDAIPGFSGSDDLLIDVTGITASFPTGLLAVNNVFSSL